MSTRAKCVLGHLIHYYGTGSVDDMMGGKDTSGMYTMQWLNKSVNGEEVTEEVVVPVMEVNDLDEKEISTLDAQCG